MSQKRKKGKQALADQHSCGPGLFAFGLFLLHVDKFGGFIWIKSDTVTWWLALLPHGKKFSGSNPACSEVRVVCVGFLWVLQTSKHTILG